MEFTVGNDKPQVFGTIDPYMMGSIFRWCNHSCDAICEFLDSRVGNTRFCAVVVKEGKNLVYPAEVTIDYGDDYFKDIDACSCGSANCQKLGKASRKSKVTGSVLKQISKKSKAKIEDDEMDMDERDDNDREETAEKRERSKKALREALANDRGSKPRSRDGKTKVADKE